ncbi:MAG: efflux RND transporter periplasmic adaptor subunit [Nitrospirota bacterium]
MKRVRSIESRIPAFLPVLRWACTGITLLACPGCDTAPGDATGARPVQPSTQPGIVRLAPEALAQIGIETKPVAKGEFRSYRDFPGTVQPNENALAEITALVRGRILDVHADLGQEVKAGALLALLYSSELGIAQSSYLKANAKLHLAEQAFGRAQLLLKEKVIGRSEFQRRQGDLVSARAEAREARDRLQLLGMKDKEIRELERKERIRSHVPIHAPFDGRIIARNVTRGEVINTSDRLFVVADLSTVWVLANVPEKDIPPILRSVEQNRSVEVHVSAYQNQVFPGRITYVGDLLDPATRTMKVRVEVPNSDGRLKGEMFASVRIPLDPLPDSLTVPVAAVQQDQGETIVFVQVADRQFARRTVRLGGESGGHILVLGGLSEGELVVTQGAFVLRTELAKTVQGGPLE